MAGMIRRHVYLDERHDRMLKHQAHGRGVTETQVIQEALDRIALEAPTAGRERGNRSAAARRALAFMRSLASRPVEGARAPDWARNELYREHAGRPAKS